MTHPSEFFKQIPEAEYTAKIQKEAEEYDKLAQAHHLTCEEELTGEKLVLCKISLDT